MRPPDEGNDWVALTGEPLRAGPCADWAVLPGCGAVVVFTGTVRDFADGRTGVVELTYEAYEEQATARLAAVVDDVRRRWPVVGRVAALHRLGTLALGEASVVVAVSAPHRGEAFEAARHAIDTLKATVPIWKRERWADGEGWALGAQPVRSVGEGSA